jgi:multicomponent K+:H+ antiporter subunit A
VLQGPPPAHNLAIWHGVSPALWMSVIALLGGALLYSAASRCSGCMTASRATLDARAIYEHSLEGVRGLARGVTRTLEAIGSLQRQAALLVAALVLGTAGMVSALRRR